MLLICQSVYLSRKHAPIIRYSTSCYAHEQSDMNLNVGMLGMGVAELVNDFYIHYRTSSAEDDVVVRVERQTPNSRGTGQNRSARRRKVSSISSRGVYIFHFWKYQYGEKVWWQWEKTKGKKGRRKVTKKREKENKIYLFLPSSI